MRKDFIKVFLNSGCLFIIARDEIETINCATGKLTLKHSSPSAPHRVIIIDPSRIKEVLFQLDI